MNEYEAGIETGREELLAENEALRKQVRELEAQAGVLNRIYARTSKENDVLRKRIDRMKRGVVLALTEQWRPGEMEEQDV